MYLLQVYLLQVYLLQVYLLADRHAGKPRPFGAKIQHFAHLIDELRSRIVVPPASSGAKFDEVPLPTLNKASQPRAILSYGLCCRSDMKEAKPQLNRRFSILNVHC